MYRCAADAPAAEQTDCGDAFGLCDICAGNCVGDEDDYSDYQGAFRCLVEGAGDVAFIKHTTIDDYIDSSWAAGKEKNDFRLLCPTAAGMQCAMPDDYIDCNLARVPAHAAGVNPAVVSAETRDAIRAAFEVANKNAEFKNMFLTDGNNSGNLVFKSGTEMIIPVTEGTVSFMAAAYDAYEALSEIEDIEPTPCAPEQVRWCAIEGKEEGGETELQRCESMATLMNGIQAGVEFSCVEEESDNACIAALAAGTADIVTLDGGDIFDAHKSFGFETVVGETYGYEVGASYFALAVVNADECGSMIGSLADLAGKRYGTPDTYWQGGEKCTEHEINCVCAAHATQDTVRQQDGECQWVP